MKLFESNSENYIEFLFSKMENSHKIECSTLIFKGGNIVFNQKAIVPILKFQKLADWLDYLWDECDPFIIEELNLKFEFSHREHIGEGYYYILVDNIKYLYIYEQLGQSNTAHAKELRESIS